MGFNRVLGLYTSLRSCGRRMSTAYFRHHEGSETFQVTFHYRNDELGFNRQFNLSRRVTESVEDFLNRIAVNIEKVLSKKKKKRKAEPDSSANLCVELYRNGTAVSSEITCKDMLTNTEHLSLSISGISYEVVINAPTVDSITLPGCIMAGFPVYPSKLELSFARKQDSKFTWYRCAVDSSNECLEVWSGYYFTPTSSDISYLLKIKCVPGKGDRIGPVCEAVSKNVVEAGPGRCPFEDRHAFTCSRLPSESIRVMSYNILADLYADSDTARTQLFPYCPPYALNVDYRKQLLIKEILGYNTDLICLQEVDSKIFNNDLLPVLESEGYDGVFDRKGKTVSEGLACFFHTSKFRLLQTQSKSLSEELPTNPLFSEIWTKIKTNEALSSRILARTTSLQVTVLNSVHSERSIVIGNTHLYFHPDADHIRLLQAGMVVLYLQDILTKIKELFPERKVTVMLCGDFNSTPDCGVYHLMTQQIVKEDAADWHSNEAEAVKGVSLSHSIKFASACGTPDFTNYTEGFSGCLDYIFFPVDDMEVLQVIPLPSEEELKQHTALPSVVFPSDHISLVSDLKWKS